MALAFLNMFGARSFAGWNNSIASNQASSTSLGTILPFSSPTANYTGANNAILSYPNLVGNTLNSQTQGTYVAPQLGNGLGNLLTTGSQLNGNMQNLPLPGQGQAGNLFGNGTLANNQFGQGNQQGTGIDPNQPGNFAGNIPGPKPVVPAVDPFEAVKINPFNGQKILGAACDDQLHGSRADDVIAGGAGNDKIWGKEGNDQIFGNSGNDNIWGEHGNDAIYGGAGDDRLYGGSGDDLIIGGAGNDEIYGESGLDTLIGGDGNDRIFGGCDADIIVGGRGDDYINAGHNSLVDYSSSGASIVVNLQDRKAYGADIGCDTLDSTSRVKGTDFNDTLIGDACGQNELIGGAGNDQLFGRGGDDTLNGGAGNDLIDGGEGRDFVNFDGAGSAVMIDLVAQTATGTATGQDQLVCIENAVGSSFADQISGNAGDNIIVGGKGADELTGGLGRDTFRIDCIDESPSVPGKFDLITDFTVGQDKIDLSRIDANVTNGPGCNDGFRFIRPGDSCYGPGALWVEYDDKPGFRDDVTYLKGDVNGDGCADLTIAFFGLQDLQHCCDICL